MCPYHSMQMRANEKLGLRCMCQYVKPNVVYPTLNQTLMRNSNGPITIEMLQIQNQRLACVEKSQERRNLGVRFKRQQISLLSQKIPHFKSQQLWPLMVPFKLDITGPSQFLERLIRVHIFAPPQCRFLYSPLGANYIATIVHRARGAMVQWFERSLVDN